MTAPSNEQPAASNEPRGANDAVDEDLLRISELAERADVPVATVRHYLREGLLPEPVKTSRNMAYYPPGFVDRIRLIKQLQEERFMPLRVIRGLLERERREPERLRAMIELEDRILDRALVEERERVPSGEVLDRFDVPAAVLERLAELGILSPDQRGYSPSDVRVIEAIGRFRAGGYDESLGFTVYDTLRYKRALEPLVSEEVRVLTERLAGDLEPDRAVEIIQAGAEPLNDLIAALHTKLLVARLERDRPARGRLPDRSPGRVATMEARHPDQASEHEDARATEPPAESDPQEGERSRRSSDDQGGPLGNPEVDEEALGHRQQDGE